MPKYQSFLEYHEHDLPPRVLIWKSNTLKCVIFRILYQRMPTIRGISARVPRMSQTLRQIRYSKVK